MAYKLIVVAEAFLDIDEAVLWYEEQQKGLGKRLFIAIKNELAIIRKSHFKYVIRYDDIRTALPKTFPYLIHFSNKDNTIIVKAVYHTSRDSEKWNDL